MRIVVTLIIAGFCQHAAAAAAPEKSKRTCRILFLSAPIGAPQKLFLADGTAAQEVELPSMNLSKVYALPAGDLTLAMLPTMPEPKTPLPVGAPTAVVAEAMQDLYILVASDPANKVTPIRFQVINADADGFRNGKLLWFNLSPHRIGGKIGTQTLNLLPKTRLILDAPASAAGDYNVKIGYVPVGSERAEPLCETVWQHDPQSKYIVFVLSVPDSRMPRIMGFPDFRVVEKKTGSP